MPTAIADGQIEQEGGVGRVSAPTRSLGAPSSDPGTAPRRPPSAPSENDKKNSRAVEAIARLEIDTDNLPTNASAKNRKNGQNAKEMSRK